MTSNTTTDCLVKYEAMQKYREKDKTNKQITKEIHNKNEQKKYEIEKE